MYYKKDNAGLTTLGDIRIDFQNMKARFSKCSIAGDKQNEEGRLRFKKYDDTKKNYWSIKIKNDNISVSCNGDEAISSSCEAGALDAIEYLKLDFQDESILDYISLPGELRSVRTIFCSDYM